MQRNFTAVTGARSGKSAENEALLSQQRAILRARLALSKDGSITCSVENCVLILENDPVLMGAIRKNLFTGCMVIVGDMPWHRAGNCFTDDDLAFIELLFENHYGITSEKKILTALRVVANSNGYHPVREYLNHLDWDRTPRVRFALHHFLGAEISDLNEELLRLFMLGAVTRIFQPGHKFDMMLCLTGGQGAGKSSFFRFLAGNDEWFSDDLRRLDDENIYRRMMGHWIIEMSEMMATGNAKNVEEIKSFLSRQKDTYKVPYDKFPADRPRQCVFAGTSNKLDFLPHDRSGNRRFLPIRIDPDKAEVHILANQQTSRAYFNQLWAEIMVIYRSGEYSLQLSKEASKQLKQEQTTFMPENTLDGQVLGFMEQTAYKQVCSTLIFAEALHSGTLTRPQAWETRNICDVVNNAIASGELKGWHSYQGSRRYALYGKQRGWERDCDPEQINRNSVETGANHFPAVKPADNFPL